MQFKLPKFIEITNSPFLITISKESDHEKIIKYLVEQKKDFTFCDDFQYSQPCYKLKTDSIDVIAEQLIEKEKNSIINCDILAIEFQEKELLHTNGIIDTFKKLCSDSHLIQEAIETKDVNKCA